jgi:hypothetical protein
MFKKQKKQKKKLELQKIVKENIEYSRFFSFEMKFSWGQQGICFGADS